MAQKGLKLYIFIFVVLCVLGVGLRVYNFPNRVSFSLEQGISLTTTYNYLHSKFSLLGIPNIQRYTSTGLQTYSPPFYNYFLVPFMLILGENPITLTYLSLFINITTAVLLAYVVYRLSGHRIALFTFIYFIFNLTMIDQSLTIWILNLLPLIGLLGMQILLTTKNYTWYVGLGLGILSGIGVSLEWMFLLTSFILLIYIHYKSKTKIATVAGFIIGNAIPLLPTIIFELRHNFYHLQTLYQYALDTFQNPGQGSMQFYHFYHLLPAVFYFMGYLTDRIFTWNRGVSCFLISCYIYLNLTSPDLNLSSANGMGGNINTPQLIQIAQVISSSAGPYYNVVYLPNSEYRAYSLRYILTAMYDSEPMPIDAYPSSDELYVVAESSRDIEQDLPWEISVFKSIRTDLIYTSPDGHTLLYKMTK